MRKTKPKILIVADAYPTKKNILSGNYIKQQVDEIKKQNPDWDVRVYHNPFVSIFSNPFEKQSLFWKALKWGMQLIAFIPQLFIKYDLVHAHRFFLPVFNAAVYKFFHHVPLVVTSHGIVQIRKRYNKPWTKKLFNYCDKIIAVNHSMKDEFIENLKLSDEKILVRSCGIDFKVLEKAKKKKQPKTDDNKLVLGFIGDYSENKRPFLFLDCIKDIYNEVNVKGVMIGGGVLSNEIEKYIKDNNLPVTVLGTLPHNELLSYYNKFDALIFPSASETFGIAGIEALYYNVPVISSNVGGKKDYIQHDYNGLLFPKDDLEELKRMTLKLLQDPILMRNMKNNASKSIKEYSNLNVVSTIIRVYESLLHNEER